MKRILIAGIMIVLARVNLCPADPAPLPADPQVLQLVNQLSQDSLNAIVSGLVGFYTRHTFSDTISATTGIGAARNWLLSRFNRPGSPAHFFTWTTPWGGNPAYPCRNVHATTPGTLPRLVILGAHYDSRTVSEGDITGFAPGADDDGSGVSALSEISRILAGQPLAATVVTAAFSGEEQGLFGSTAYADSLHNAGAPVTGMINMDMIGHIVDSLGVDTSTVRCFSGDPMGSSSRQLARWVKWVGESYSDGLTVLLQPAIDRPNRGGDHMPFYDDGYPSCRLIETAEDVAFQHGPPDVPANMSFSYARKIARLALGAASVLAKAQEPLGSPTVQNYGDGHSVNVTWPQVAPGTVVLLAFRADSQLYWERIDTLSGTPPTLISGLDSGKTYQFSLAFCPVGTGLPSLFSPEAGVALVAAPAPDGFDSESKTNGVQLNWIPRQEPSTQDYLVERAVPGGDFQQIAVVAQPGASYFDATVQPLQMYLYRVRTRNTQLFIGSPSVVQEGRLATHDQGLLLVDATPNGSGPPLAPQDAPVDSFYAAQTSNYLVAGQWDRQDSVALGVTLSDADLAPYDAALVYADYHLSQMADDTTALRKYLNNGGKLLLTGWRLSRALTGSMALTHSYGPGSFLYDLAGIDSTQVSPAYQCLGSQGQAGYPGLVLDTTAWPIWTNGLIFGEAAWTNTFPPEVQVVGTFHSSQGSGSPFQGKPNVWKGGAGSVSWVLSEAPLYYMTSASATEFITHALTDLNAPLLGIAPQEKAGPYTFRLDLPRPNPFNPSTALSYELQAASLVKLTVWDITGKLVATLVNNWQAAGDHDVIFNGERLASGLYFAKLRAGDFSAVRKLVLMK